MCVCLNKHKKGRQLNVVCVEFGVGVSVPEKFVWVCQCVVRVLVPRDMCLRMCASVFTKPASTRARVAPMLE